MTHRQTIGLVLLICAAVGATALAAQTWSHTDNFAEGTVAGNLTWDESYCGTSAGTVATNRDGWLITTNAAALKVHGLVPLANSLQAATNFYKTSDSPYMVVKLKTPAALTGDSWMIGFHNAEPNTDPNDPNAPTATQFGGYNNAALVEGAWFWYEAAANSGKLCVGYRDAAGVNVALTVLDVTVAVSTEYELQISFDSLRKPHFSVDGTELHVATVAIADVDVQPHIYAIGNATTLYIREVTVGKTYQ